MEQNKKGFSEIIFVFVVLVLLGVVGFFVFQNEQLKQEITTEEAVEPISDSSEVSTPTTKPATLDWEAYENSSVSFTIKHPAGWRSIGGSGYVGFGPQEIKEDVLLGITIYSKSKKTLQEIKDSFGEQFLDRVQNEENININGLKAIQVITTTSQISDWYSVNIIIENNDEFYVIGNGAQTDTALNAILLARTGKEYNITFEDFYSTFRLTN